MPDTDIIIAPFAFSYTEYYNNQENWDNGVLYVGNHLIEVDYEYTGSLIVREGTKTIASDAAGWTAITDVTLPDGLLRISEAAFWGCFDMESITIPATVKSIDDMAFGIGDFPDLAPLEDFTVCGTVGTVAEEYAKNNGLNFVPISYDTLLVFDETTGTVTNVKERLTLKSVSYSVTNKDGTPLKSDEFIGTGCFITKDSKDYTVIVTGDTSGDGMINSTDYMQIRRQYLEIFSMSDTQKLAGDTDCDGKINSTDFTQIRRHFLGLYSLTSV